MKKTKRIEIAKNTLELLKTGAYINSHGTQVNLPPQPTAQYYPPETLVTIREEILTRDKQFSHTQFEVFNETTLQGAQALSKKTSTKIGILNFASAKNPGGGFLNGAQAQEESLARSSGLYLSLLQAPDYYNSHRQQKSCFYSDRMIYSADCPVFRRDNGELLTQPYLVDFITSPAPNAGVITRRESENIDKIAIILRERCSKLLSLFVYHGCDSLVLGAWGCGVFQNQPAMVARVFYDYLAPDGIFYGRFGHIRFSVLDNSKAQTAFSVFHNQFLFTTTN